MTKNQRAYKKEVQRLKRGIQRARKKGYLIDYEFEIPKRITAKRLAEIKSLKPRDIYKKGVKVDIETGEILGKASQYLYKTEKPKTISPEQYIREQQETRIKSPEEIITSYERPAKEDYLSDDTWADIIINSLVEQVSFNEKLVQYVERNIKEYSDKYGKIELAKAIENSAIDLIQYIIASQYGASMDGVGSYFSDIIRALPFDGSAQEYSELETDLEFMSTELDWNEI